jgi:hypothetical protein
LNLAQKAFLEEPVQEQPPPPQKSVQKIMMLQSKIREKII